MNKLALMTTMARERGPARILAFLALRLAKSLRLGFVAPGDRDDAALPVEVVYVATDKDLATLPHSLASLDLCRGVEVRSIVIVGPPGSQIEDFARDRGLRFHSEIDVLGFGPERYQYPLGSNGSRSGWLFQQMLKFGWSMHAEKPAYIVIDADTVLLRPVSFFDDGKYILYRSEEWHNSYASAVRLLTGVRDRSLLSFVAHMMIFDVSKVRRLLAQIEERAGVFWADAIAATRPIDDLSCFSEYQLFGSWMKQSCPDLVKSAPLYNRSVTRETLLDASRRAELSRSVHTVSAHSYIALNELRDRQ